MWRHGQAGKLINAGLRRRRGSIIREAHRLLTGDEIYEKPLHET